MTDLFGPDLSNWNMITAATVSCLKGHITGPPVVRVSLENPTLSATTVQQLQAFQSQNMPTMGYPWPYGSDVPEQVAQAAVQLVDPYIGLKRLWADVEDTANFLPRPGMPPGGTPLRWRSVDRSKASLKAIGPAAAVSWLRRWVNEVRTLGYLPGFYSAPGVWQTITGGDTSFDDVDGWGADWDNIADPRVIDPWGGITNWIGKQYLGSGNAPTLCGQAFDLNVWVQERLQPAPVPEPPQPEPASGEPEADRINSALQARFALMRQALVLMEDAVAADVPGGNG